MKTRTSKVHHCVKTDNPKSLPSGSALRMGFKAFCASVAPTLIILSRLAPNNQRWQLRFKIPYFFISCVHSIADNSLQTINAKFYQILDKTNIGKFIAKQLTHVNNA